MLKKICLLLIFWIVLPTMFLANAENETGKEEVDAITIVDEVVPKVDEGGYMILTGKAINNSKGLLHSIEIVFDIVDFKGNTLDSTTATVIGKQEGILEGGEVGTFETKTKVLVTSVASYSYKINWISFAKKKQE